MEYKILDAIEVKPWIRVAVLTVGPPYDQRVISTLWQGRGGIYLEEPGVTKPRKAHFSKEVFRISWDEKRGLYEARIRSRKGGDFILTGPCEQDLAKKAWRTVVGIKE